MELTIIRAVVWLKLKINVHDHFKMLGSMKRKKEEKSELKLKVLFQRFYSRCVDSDYKNI